MMDDPHYWPITVLAARLRAGAVSSEAVTRHLLARIERLDPQLNAYQTVMAETALAAARKADAELAQGFDRGPLHGVPVAIKDCILTEDAPTTVGSAVLADTLPRRDATVVRRLKAAGAVLLGKLVLTEGTLVEHLAGRPAPLNPWDATLWTGVSSSGSGVATAAGLCFASLGTDTGGSIRMPSAANGLTGLKPTWGRVSLDGVFPMCPSRDHVGPMARSAQDAALVMAAIAGHDPADPLSLPDAGPDYGAEALGGCAGLRLGVDRRALESGVEPETAAALARAVEVLADLGMRVQEFTFPSPDAYLDIYAVETAAALAVIHAPTYLARAADYGAVLSRTIERASTFSAIDLLRAEQEKARFRGALNAALADVDVAILPMFAGGAPTVADLAAAKDPAAIARSLGRFVLPLNASGHPALSAPCGLDRRGAPIALQLIGPLMSDGAVVRAAAAYQRATDWHTRRPPTSA